MVSESQYFVVAALIYALNTKQSQCQMALFSRKKKYKIKSCLNASITVVRYKMLC